MNDIDQSMVRFFKQCTDAQLEHNLKREWDAQGHRDYQSALVAAVDRGWDVREGKRIT